MRILMAGLLALVAGCNSIPSDKPTDQPLVEETDNNTDTTQDADTTPIDTTDTDNMSETSPPLQTEVRIQISPLAASDTTLQGGTEDVIVVWIETRREAFMSSIAFTLVGDDEADVQATIGPDGNILPSDLVASCELHQNHPLGPLIGTSQSVDPTTNKVTFGNIDHVFVGTFGQNLFLVCTTTTGGVIGAMDELIVQVLPDDLVFTKANGDPIVPDAIELTPRSGVNTASPYISTIVRAAGEVICATDAGSPEETILLGETEQNQTAVFSCTSSFEATRVSELTFTNCVTETPDLDRDCADPGETLGLDDALTEVTLGYVNALGQYTTTSQVFVGGRITFVGLDLLLIEGVATRIDVLVNVGVVSPMNIFSGEVIQTNLDTRGMSGMGETTQTPAAFVDDYIIGSQMVLRHSRPQPALAGSSPRGVRPPGRNEVFRYNVAAATQGDVGKNAVLYGITTTDLAGTGWNLCENLGQPEMWQVVDLNDRLTLLDEDHRWVFYDVLGGACNRGDVVGYASLTFEPTLTVEAGTVRTFSLSADLSDADPFWADAIQIWIPDQAEANILGVPAIGWDDFEGGGYGIDGALIPLLPITGNPILISF